MQEERYWQAVLERDRTLDGTFVYAVHSTKVYCNPSCPSRRPRRDGVRFFMLPQDAEQAGYRPCLRCCPRETFTGEPHVAIVERACTYIKNHSDTSVTLAELSEQVHMSHFYLQRIFKRIMGITPHQYAEACRLQQFKQQLKKTETVTTAMYEVGYGSSSRLYERAASQLGMTPRVYQRGGRDMHIAYTVVGCRPGRLLVAATEKGVCAVSLGDTDEELEAALLKEYPAAQIEREDPVSGDDQGLHRWVRELVQYLDGQDSHPHLDLPLDVQATAFQWSVWQHLQAIPYGETRSYGEIAQELGDVHKARAVARACATNPVALVIPCHRVVRGDGENGGYRWGIERKRQLLAQEKSRSAEFSVSR